MKPMIPQGQENKIYTIVKGRNWYESVVNLTALLRDAADDVIGYIQHIAPFCTVKLSFFFDYIYIQTVACMITYHQKILKTFSN